MGIDMDNYFAGCPARMSDGRHLTDYRSSHKRELFNMQSNGISRSDDWRMFLQQNGEKLMDGEWCYMKNNHSCQQYPCFHEYGTKTTPGELHDEMKAYNSVKSGKSKAPECKQRSDYRATVTRGSCKQCKK